jgi:hypothetical protein
VSDRAVDPMNARCGARNRAGNPCRRHPMPNGRCNLHGGKSTGPRTVEGKARHRASVTTHGCRTGDAAKVRALLR